MLSMLRSTTTRRWVVPRFGSGDAISGSSPKTLSSMARVIYQESPEASKKDGDIVQFLTLSNLSDNPGAIKKKRRVGRGIGSSKGKTCGRGHKGQKSRSGGGVRPTFEGGQTPFHKRLPKRGFTNKNHKEEMLPVNLGMIQDYVDMGRLVLPKPHEPPLTIKDLVDAGITNITRVKHGMKLLAKGKERLRSPIRIEISRASGAAIEAIEGVGGEVTTVHYNKLALRALLKPHRFDIIPKRARPPPKLMTYYTDYDNRGYLAPETQLKKLNLQLQNFAVDDVDDVDDDETKEEREKDK
mmetsp:Transcript_25715/g.37943  ORF Transcript_25715/g.37943 Transcript_25715/m.37943 type:complete len:297 (+) Transcript_25715:52-942(+)|eukprot:CAMPEP_0195526070 /NCGR_PEP_ID=MMETSP0794_2-20130614/26923_1 /TAXON_ID=515487 /ORGANISM="Stephanopyxis turris, Strain CCMP 815" /LENGTH=296 /DNA_ID=CAMNT_0040656683 /DNA_START=48 /DNA_END=938 /DNA_ORIENTATION=+